MKQARVLSTMLMLLAVGGTTVARAQADQGRGRGRADQPPAQAPAKVSPAEQKQRVQQEQQRSTQLKQHLNTQVKVVQQQTAQLQTQQRVAQARTQQDYAAQLQRQQQAQRTQPARDIAHDPYITTPHTYRYDVGGSFHQTNEYGATVLRQSVNDGYQQGYRAGLADRQDHWASNYQNSPAYRDASYGFGGSYIDLSDYQYYFREGFVRGYGDGYDAQLRYGSNSNGTVAILAGVLTSILGLSTIH
jgi:hypothetical protein